MESPEIEAIQTRGRPQRILQANFELIDFA
jgi:hypothetical protein